MIRKPSKMPNVVELKYDLEYGSNTLQIQKGAADGHNVLIIDDLLATGGTALAACKLVEQVGGKVAGVSCLIELVGLPGRKVIENAGYSVFTLIHYDVDSDTQIPLKTSPVQTTVVSSKQEIVEAFKSKLKLHQSFGHERDDERVVVFAHQSMQSLAQEMCVSFGEQYRHGHISWQRFPDRSPNIQFEKDVENKHVVFIGSLYNPDQLLDQLSVMMVLPRQHISSLTIVIPYFATATMERVEKEGVVATAETTAKIVASCLPLTRQGPASVMIYDIHALPVRFYFTDNVMVKMLTAIPLLLNDVLHARRKTDPITVAFPDEGASKRFKSVFEGFPQIVCSKVRDGDKRIVKIVDRHYWPKNDAKAMDHVLIIDDLVQSGGTLFECRNALLEFGAKKVSAYVTHPVFPNQGWKRFAKGGDREGFEHFFVTNTIPDVAIQLENVAPFHVLHIEEHLSKEILNRLHLPSNKTESSIIRAYVTSTKKSKLEAVRSVLQSKYKKEFVQVFGCSVESGINNQPSSKEETKKGAHARLEALYNQVDLEMKNLSKSDELFLTRHTSQVLYISLENGISQKGDKWVDACFCVVAKDKNGDRVETSAWTDSVDVPDGYADRSKETGFKVTCGSMIEEDFGIVEDGWHQRFGPSDRTTLIAKALASVL
jgi:ribose-phosphate pyrophosphokinase